MKKTDRSSDLELIDLGPSCYTAEEYDDCLYQLSRVGHLLGGNSATLNTLEKLPPFQSLLDVGCGGGYFTKILAQKFPKAQILGIDTSTEAIAHAKSKNLINNAHLNFLVPATPQLMYSPNSFDVVTSTLVCHHLNDEQLIDFLKRSYLTAKHSVVINDLHRHWLAYGSYLLISKPLFANRLITHDGLLSIKRAFKKNDWIEYLAAADIPLKYCKIQWHWAFRWIVEINSSNK